jgi:metal-responsive CopG/Arc/MetJ family transcriptional regulator
MGKTVSTRLEEDEIKRLNDISEKEKIDRSALIRQFLLQKMEEYQMRREAEYYRNGIKSLQEAAAAAKVSLYDMMDFVNKEQIRPPPQTQTEMEEEFSEGEII